VPYVLGIDIGAGATKAAVCRRTDGSVPGWGPAQPVTLGLRSRTVGSGLVMTPEGDVVPADYGRSPAANSVGGYLHRVGDSLPMLFGGDYFPAHGLVAAMARWVVDRVWQQLDEPPERIALAYPSGWGNGRLHLVHSALGEADLAQTALVTRARAVVESHQAAGRMPAAGGTLLAYRIGGSTCEVSVVVSHGPGRLELLGCAELAEVSGFDLRDATPADARAVVQSTVDLALHTLSSCGATRGDLAAVLIAGGTEHVYPHVSDLLSAAFPVPVLRDPDPPMTVAAGAALAVRPLVRRPAPPPAAPPAAIAPQLPGAQLPGTPAPETASLPTASWPEITADRRAQDRPPRPPVAVTAVRAEGR
jgi:molecular chaperone DnaK (HSP70)